MERLLAREDVAAACRLLAQDDERTLREQVELTEIPAPSFHEGPRGDRVATLLRDAGARQVTKDEVGNVLARMGPDEGAPFIVSAHLDTVFPAGTNVTVSERNGRYVGPGISDDARGLAALLALARALDHETVPLAGPLLLAATVGEEGAGDLRGCRHLFRSNGPGASARGFISLDGAGISRIVSRAIGARRLRAVVRGPGGHSWVDFGMPNPIHALGAAVEAVARIPLPDAPASTATVARWGGGRSINAIPAEAWIELDLRSEGGTVLSDIESRTRESLAAAVRRSNQGARARQGTLSLEVTVVGDRPAGRTLDDSLLVTAALAATRALGREPELVASSTDANVPMSLGIPAVTMGAGGEAGKAHTQQEWYTNTGGSNGIVRALLTILLVVGVGETAPQAPLPSTSE